MEFGRHLTKGVWAFADKALPAIYGLGFIFLVIRVLPASEYGAFVIVQTVLNFSTSLCYALALQPLTKFAAESSDRQPYVTASAVLSVIFYAVISIGVLVCRPLLVPLFDAANQSHIDTLLLYLPLLFLVTFYRNIVVGFLQAVYQVQKIFWIDAIYFIGIMGLIAGATWLRRFSTAEDLLQLTVIAYGCSTLLAVALTLRQIPLKAAYERSTMRAVWEYGKYTFGATSIYTLFTQADIFFVGSVVGLVGVATYNAAKVLTRVFDMLVQVIQMFVLPASSKLHAEGKTEDLRTVAEKSIMFSTLLLIPVFLVMILFPSTILSLLYKGRYVEGAPVMATFAFLAFIYPVNAVCVSIIQGIGHVKYSFKVSGILLVLAAACYPLLVPAYGIVGAAMAYVAVMAIMTVIVAVYVRRIVGFTVGGIVARTSDAVNFVMKRRK